nr:microfibril-associated glycoprotein 4-like [Cherax quadricarinatus]
MAQCNKWVVGVSACVAVSVVMAVGPSVPAGRQPAVEIMVDSEDNRHGVDQLALLQEMRTITDIMLRLQKKDETPPPPPPVVHDCSTLHQAGVKGSGKYQVFPFTFLVYCDMSTHGGGWTVVQRRKLQEVQEDFDRGWADYRNGFGNLDGEMWLGLEPLHQLTYSASYELRVDMFDYQLGHLYAHYKNFRVGPESDGYRLLATNYSGDAGDALSIFHSGLRFSTLDRDQDLARNKSCAQDKEGGWWFHACYAAHLNGRHSITPSRKGNGTEIRWWSNRERVLVLTHVEMKIRRRRSEGAAGNKPTDDVTADDTQGETPIGGTDDSYHDSTMSPTKGYAPWWPAFEATSDHEDENVINVPGGRADVNPWEVVRPQME